MSVIPMWAKALILAAIIGGFYWVAYSNGKADCIAAQTESQLEQMKESRDYERGLMSDLRDTSQKLQDAILNVKTVVEFRDRVVTREVEKPIYQSCVVPESGVEIINDSVDQLNALRGK